MPPWTRSILATYILVMSTSAANLGLAKRLHRLATNLQAAPDGKIASTFQSHAVESDDCLL
jgi:hypothetical protein